MVFKQNNENLYWRGNCSAVTKIEIHDGILYVLQRT